MDDYTPPSFIRLRAYYGIDADSGFNTTCLRLSYPHTTTFYN